MAVATTALIVGGLAAAATVGAAAISSNAQKSAASKAADLANQQMADAKAEQARLEEKFGLTPGELAREQRLFGIPEGDEAIKFVEGSLGLEAKQQTELEKQAGMTGEELLASVGPDTKALLETVAKRQGMTGEELFTSEGAIPAELQKQILADVQNPGGDFENTLSSQLELARTMVNAEANKRGVFGGTPEGGIRFENLGRAGVDLAIKSAESNEAARQQDLANASTLSTLFQNLSAGARADASSVAQSGLTAKTDATNRLTEYINMLENASAAAKGRAANVAVGASSQAANTTNQAYSNLIGIEGYKGQITSPAAAALTSIGTLGADYLGGQLSTVAKNPTTTTSTYDELMKTQGDSSDQFETLGGISGSEMATLKKKYPNLVY